MEGGINGGERREGGREMAGSEREGFAKKLVLRKNSFQHFAYLQGATVVRKLTSFLASCFCA